MPLTLAGKRVSAYPLWATRRPNMYSPGNKDGFSGARFRTTHWSVVREAGIESESSQSALETLCRAYWVPLYVYARGRGYCEHEAEDLTQEFFARLLEGDWLQTADPEKGRFRNFLLTAMKRFLAKEWRDSHRIKRGGQVQILSWEELDPSQRSLASPTQGIPAEVLFDKRWAQTVAANALQTLRGEWSREGLEDRFEVLKSYLQGGEATATYAEAALRLNLSEAAVKSAIHRMRRRYGQLIREIVANTVSEEKDVEEEIRHLIEVLSAS